MIAVRAETYKIVATKIEIKKCNTMNGGSDVTPLPKYLKIHVVENEANINDIHPLLITPTCLVKDDAVFPKLNILI